MLNMYFAFGVPLFLLVLYGGFALFRKRSQIPYLGFVLFVIAGFGMAFSFQVLQNLYTELDLLSRSALEKQVGYPLMLLWIPFVISSAFVITNIFRGYHRIRKIRQNSLNKPKK